MAARVGLSREKDKHGNNNCIYFFIEPTKLLFIVIETYVIDFTDDKSKIYQESSLFTIDFVICNLDVGSITCCWQYHLLCCKFYSFAGAILRNLCFVSKCYKLKQDIMRIKHT